MHRLTFKATSRSMPSMCFSVINKSSNITIAVIKIDYSKAKKRVHIVAATQVYAQSQLGFVFVTVLLTVLMWTSILFSF